MHKLIVGVTLAGTVTGLGCAAVSPTRMIEAIERDLTSVPEIAKHRDAAMTVLNAHYGEDVRPLDLRTAHASAVHAARVYRDVDTIRGELGEGVHVVPILTKISGLQYYIHDEGDRQVVAIRGTRPTEIRNWVASAIVLGAHDELLGVDVHEGFLLAARIIGAGVARRLDRGRPVHLTGHSLGGSLATLLGLRLAQLGYDVSVTTFGAPKITTFAAFAEQPALHRLDLVRVVNAEDVVPHFPTTMDGSGTRVYAHFGREWALTDDGRYEETSLAGSLSKSAALVLDRNMPDWSVERHGMPSVLERLERLVEGPTEASEPRESAPARPHTAGPPSAIQ